MQELRGCSQLHQHVLKSIGNKICDNAISNEATSDIWLTITVKVLYIQVVYRDYGCVPLFYKTQVSLYNIFMNNTYTSISVQKITRFYGNRLVKVLYTSRFMQFTYKLLAKI